uniref:Uncharacterized protein n=1 Tax=Aegilops tauschii subsp. strangulata TaxID=200361 RepID=A0A453IHD3_AEGTS
NQKAPLPSERGAVSKPRRHQKRERETRIKASSRAGLGAILANPREILFLFPLSSPFRVGEGFRREFVDRHGGGRGDAGGAGARGRGARGRRRRQAQLRDFLHPREQVPLRLHGPAPALAAQAAAAGAGVGGHGGPWEGGAAGEGVRALRRAAITHVLHNKHEFPFVRGVEDLLVLSIGGCSGAGGSGATADADIMRMRRWGPKEWARPIARIAADGAADLVDHAVARAFGQCHSSNYLRIQVSKHSKFSARPPFMACSACTAVSLDVN